jgi:hypothetical protein
MISTSKFANLHFREAAVARAFFKVKSGAVNIYNAGVITRLAPG